MDVIKGLQENMAEVFDKSPSENKIAAAKLRLWVEMNMMYMTMESVALYTAFLGYIDSQS